MPTKVKKYASLHALIALSNKQLSRTVWHFLKDQGIGSCQVAATSEEATSRMLQKKFSLIFVDYDLPNMGGVDFIRFLRMCDGPISEAFVVMIIGAPNQNKVVAARDGGVHEILGLPLTAHLLDVRLSHMISRPKPFIRRPSYTGPCRRRENVRIYHGTERRNPAQAIS